MPKNILEDPKTDKQNETVTARTEKDKKNLVAQLRKTPIVQLACERIGVARATYYRWRADDNIFARAADHAIEGGKFFINDLAESKLIQLIQNNNVTALIYWLKHNHPTYANRIIHEYDLTCEQQSTEEKHAWNNVFLQMLSRRRSPGFTAEETERQIEAEFAEEEKNKKIDAKLKTYQN